MRPALPGHQGHIETLQENYRLIFLMQINIKSLTQYSQTEISSILKEYIHHDQDVYPSNPRVVLYTKTNQCTFH